MSGRGFQFFWKLCCRWFWQAGRFKSLRFTGFDTDQRLLFTGSGCTLIWDIQGAYLVKVYVNGEEIGSYLPEERPRIQVQASGKLEVKACGVYRHIRRSLNLTVRELVCQEAATATLTKSDLLRPPVVQDFLLRLKNLEPNTPRPVIYQRDIFLDTPYRKELETELQERLTQYQLIAEKPNPYFYGN